MLLLFDAFDLGDDVGDLFAASEALVQLGERVVVARNVRQDRFLVRPGKVVRELLVLELKNYIILILNVCKILSECSSKY